MKIHIVQKGDTIWDIAEKYGVGFEDVKEVNPQLSSPDMIMPGMKIKIPSNSKPVKHKKEHPKKEMKKKPSKEQMSQPKPIPKIEVDDTNQTNHMEAEKPIGWQPLMPIQPSPQLKEYKQEFIKPQTNIKSEKKEIKTEEIKIKEKQQPQMPSFDELPKLEKKPKEQKKQAQDCEPVEHPPNCHCYQMPNPCCMSHHMMGCYPLPMPCMHQGHMMPHQPMGYQPEHLMHPQQPMVEHPQYMMPIQNTMPVHQNHMDNHQTPSQHHHVMPIQSEMGYRPQQAHMHYNEGTPSKVETLQNTPYERENTREPLFTSEIQGHPVQDNTGQFSQPPLYPSHPRMNKNE